MDWRRHTVILALYGALSLVLTMPVILNLNTHVAGQGGDPWQTMWRFEEALRRAPSTLNFVQSEFFGGGEPRLVNISVWPWMGLHVMFGQPAAYNLVLLLSFVLSGYFMYLLVRYFTKHEAAAFLAGLLYAFLPYHVAHSMGHFGAMQTQWLPLVILLFFLFRQRATIWRTLGLAAVITVQSWSEHHYALWLGFFAIIFVIFGWLKPRVVAWHAPYFVLLASLVFFFAILPWMPTVRLALRPSSGQASILELGTEQTTRFSADLFSYVTPPAWQPMWGGAAQELFGQHFTGNMVEATQFLGWLPPLLIAFFWRSVPRPQLNFWLTILLVFFVISLGPWLHVFGRVLPIPLPYGLFDEWPVFSAVRAVARAGVMVGVAVSILFGYVLAREMRRPISVWLVAGIVLIEFLFLPFPVQSTRLSNAYDVIAELPGQSILEIPAGTNYTVASKSLYVSLLHGKAVVGNIALERALPAGAFEEVKSLPGLRQLLFLRTDHLLEDRVEFFDQDLRETIPDVLTYLDISAIVVQADSLSAKQRQAVMYWLEDKLKFVPEQYEDVVLYKTVSTPGVETDGIFLARDGRWANVGFDPRRNSVFAEIPGRADVTLYNVTTEAKAIELTFLVEQGSVRVNGSVTVAGQRASVPLVVQPGKRLVEFISQLPDPAVIRDPRLLVR